MRLTVQCSILVLVLTLATSLARAADVEFEGIPSLKIEVHEGASQTSVVPPTRAREFDVKIVRVGAAYVWASRNNLPMTRQDSGAYVTYTASNGAGYVRVLSPAMRKSRQSLPAAQREKEFVYMEHQ